jgi:hypothetical protein
MEVKPAEDMPIMGLCKTNEEHLQLPAEFFAVMKYAYGETRRMTSIYIRHQVLRCYG